MLKFRGASAITKELTSGFYSNYLLRPDNYDDTIGFFTNTSDSTEESFVFGGVFQYSGCG